MPKILVVDDEEAIRSGLAEILEEEGYQVLTATDGRAALGVLEKEVVDVVCTDMRMPGIDGMELLNRVKAETPEIEVIVITGFASVSSAVEAVKAGAHDYLGKPFDLDEVRLTVHRALDKKGLTDEKHKLERRTRHLEAGTRLIGSSPAFQKVLELVDRVAPNPSTVLILGETGTGKELIAREIHERSDRARRLFIPVNCGALPDNLLESELFGHSKGAFTGADKANQGLFEAADGGTLFLDEIGNISLGMQQRLLRVLETGELMRLGERKVRTVDVRIIAATNADLKKAVESTSFRQDFFYRLNVLSLDLPPLRERREDIELLAGHFLSLCEQRIGKRFQGFAAPALVALRSYSWPGNVRELENAVERAAILAVTSTVQLEDLPREISETAPEEERPELASLDQLEKQHILRVLKACEGHRGRTAVILGINRRTLYRKLIDYGFEQQEPTDGGDHSSQPD